MINQVFVWLRAMYDPNAILASWSLILISYAGWHVAERFWPAQSGHKVAGILRNLGATLAYLAIGPSTKFFAASCAIERTSGIS